MCVCVCVGVCVCVRACAMCVVKKGLCKRAPGVSVCVRVCVCMCVAMCGGQLSLRLRVSCLGARVELWWCVTVVSCVHMCVCVRAEVLPYVSCACVTVTS